MSENEEKEPQISEEPSEQVEAEPVDPIEALTAERDDLLGRLQRLSADYMNYQKRAQREKQETHDFLVADIVGSILDVLDDLELAINHARQNHPADDPLLVGTEMVFNKAITAFKKFGVEPIVTEGAAFDPSLHEAISMQPSADVEPMTILADVRTGYKLKERTLRPSRVVVAQAPAKADNAGDEASDADEGGNDADV